MPIDFFEKEVEKYQKRFSQTYGEMVVSNLNLRQSAILSIINLGMISSKISRSKSKDDAREDIRQFMQVRNALNNHFNIIENEIKERRNHAGKTSDTGRCGDLRKLRQRVQC